MRVIVNGEGRDLPDGVSVERLLAELGLDRRVVAVELNGALVPRGEHERTPIREGDRVEIVTLVGGG